MLGQRARAQILVPKSRLPADLCNSCIGQHDDVAYLNLRVGGHQIFTRLSYVSGRRSRKNCHVFGEPLDEIPVHHADDHFIFVAAADRDNLAARIC